MNVHGQAAAAPAAQDIKASATRAIDTRRNDIVRLSEQIFAAPEMGFKETRTAKLVADRFRALGGQVQEGLALTGVKAVFEGGAGAGPTVAILGELDSLLSWEAPVHDPETGAAHACGHNAQIAGMLGAGMGLVESGALQYLSGRLVLFAVPAEEFIEIEERLRLRDEGKIEFLSGKMELIRTGAFDDVDMAMMVHASSTPGEGQLGLSGTANGMVAKFIRYVGKAAHAGSRPHQGVNALYAAHVAMAGINALRETFRDDDHVRVHPIVSRGGDVVSAIPADVRMETFVRGGSTEAIEDANRKVDRALRAGALALGATLELTTIPGYMPLRQDQMLTRLFRANAEVLVGRENVVDVGHRGGSTDMGDLGLIMPVLHPWASGSEGATHGPDFHVVDHELAEINPAKAMAMTVVDLLSEGGRGAREVLDGFRAPFTRDSYLRLVRGLAKSQTYSPEP